MKKNDVLMQRIIDDIEKTGEKGLASRGKLYKALAIINALAVAYLLFVNFVFVSGVALQLRHGLNYRNVESEFSVNGEILIILSALTVVEIIGAILYFGKKKSAAPVISIIPLPYFLFVFYKVSYGNPEGLFELDNLFYIRNFPEVAVIFIVAVITFVILLRERRRILRIYNKANEKLYNRFNEQKKSDDVSDEEWESFVNDYKGKMF